MHSKPCRLGSQRSKERSRLFGTAWTIPRFMPGTAMSSIRSAPLLRRRKPSSRKPNTAGLSSKSFARNSTPQEHNKINERYQRIPSRICWILTIFAEQSRTKYAHYVPPPAARGRSEGIPLNPQNHGGRIDHFRFHGKAFRVCNQLSQEKAAPAG